MVAIVMNPTSGSGGSRSLLASISALLSGRGMDVRVFATQASGDERRQTELALKAGAKDIVCVGGDGTLSEVVGALAGKDATLYIVPSGTGNDFARAFGLPHEPVAALAAQLDGTPARIDLGTINGRPFLNVSGSGFDVEVLRMTEELKSVYPGETAYRKAVLAVIGRYRAMEAELSIDGGPFKRQSVTIAEFANGQYIGGGMRVAPFARVDDGLLDVVTVVSVWHVLIPLLLPLFILGVHVRLPLAHSMRAKEAVLRCKGMTVNIDGRLEQLDEARYGILPGALRVMRPAKNR